MNPKVSLIASSVRPQLYEDFFGSLKGTSVEYEVVFAGNTPTESVVEACNILALKEIHPLKYVTTENIKPAQCYEIARREAKGEVIVWVADDAEFPNDVIGKAYKYWKACMNDRLILSIQTKESGYGLPKGKLFDMDNHRFYGYKKDTPLMAPLAMMSRQFLDMLGGFDRRYVCGQYENSTLMDAYNAGGTVEIFGGKDCFIDIDHMGKSLKIGESICEADFLNRPFASGYQRDRQVLEGSWTPLKESNGLYKRYDSFEPYEDKDILTRSQSHSGRWV